MTKQITITRRTKFAIVALTVPTVLIIGAVMAFAVVNLVFNPTFWPTPDTEATYATPLIVSILNILLFTIGTAGIVTWLPGIIVGIVLLAKPATPAKKK